MASERVKGYGYVLLAAVLWGGMGSLSRWAFQQGLSPIEVAFWRAALGALFFALHALVRGQMRVRLRDLPAFTAFGLLCIAVFYYAFQQSVAHGGAALAVVLLYTAPAWVALLSWVLLKQRPGRVTVAALALTLLGAIGVAMGVRAGGGLAGGLQPTALFFGLLSGFLYALYYLFGKRYLGRYAASTLMLYALPVGALGLYPLVPFAPKNPSAWVALLCLGFFCTYGAFWAYCRGLQRLPATRAAVAATFEPVVAALIAYLWWGEQFTPRGYVGTALVLLGIALMVSRPEATATVNRPLDHEI